jgi:branched-chain amino acid transport system substrate-binding protein
LKARSPKAARTACATSNWRCKQAGFEAGGKKIESSSRLPTPRPTPRCARPQADRAGRRRHHHRAAFGLEGHRDARLCQDDPDKTIINGISGALETTWVDPAENFFRFNLDGAQWGAGLGTYVVEEKGWTRVATVAADYSFGYTNFLGFAVDFCRAAARSSSGSGCRSARPTSAA